MENILRVVTFSRTPGARRPWEGKFSGEEYRETVVFPAISAMIARNGLNEVLTIDLDGGTGYGTSWVEEVFGGLVCENHISEAVLKMHLRIKSVEEPYLIEDVWEYIREAQEEVESFEKA